MPQYALPLSLPPVFAEDNFYVSACNRDAHQWLSRWPDWPAKTLLLYGPQGAGKSHLATIWAARAKASIVSGKGLPQPDAVNGNYAIEDIEQIGDERTLLHWLNYSREKGESLLLTASEPPKRLLFTLPDLTSRLLALPCVGIAPPDDDALAAAMRKQFADRQLKVGEDIITFLLPRIGRSFPELAHVVQQLDEHALEAKKGLTIPFLKRTLGY